MVFLGGVITTIVVLASPKSQKPTTTPCDGGGNSYDKKNQVDQAKKMYILKRFISYNPAPAQLK